MPYLHILSSVIRKTKSLVVWEQSEKAIAVSPKVPLPIQSTLLLRNNANMKMSRIEANISPRPNGSSFFLWFSEFFSAIFGCERGVSPSKFAVFHKKWTVIFSWLWVLGVRDLFGLAGASHFRVFVQGIYDIFHNNELCWWTSPSGRHCYARWSPMQSKQLIAPFLATATAFIPLKHINKQKIIPIREVRSS